MKYLEFIYHILVITIVLYMIRPTEAFCKAFYSALLTFLDKFDSVWDKAGWSALELYKRAWLVLTKGEVPDDFNKGE